MNDLISPSFKEIALSRLEKQGPGVDTISTSPQNTLSNIADQVIKFRDTSPERAGNIQEMGHKIGAGLISFLGGGAPEAVSKLGAGFTPSKEEQVDLLFSMPGIGEAKMLGAGLSGIIGHRVKHLPMPTGLKDKLSNIASTENYQKRSDLIFHPENYWTDPKTDITYSLSPQGIRFAVPAKDIQGSTGKERHLNWLRKAMETQFETKLSDAEWKKIKPELEKVKEGEEFLGRMDFQDWKIKIDTKQSSADIHKTSAHEKTHLLEGMRYQRDNLVSNEMLGTNPDAEFRKILHEELTQRFANESDINVLVDAEHRYMIAKSKITALKNKDTREEVLNELVEKVDNDVLKKYIIQSIQKDKDPERVLDTSITALTMNGINPKEVFGEELVDIVMELSPRSYDAYLSNPGEVLARQAGRLAKESKETGSFENYRRNLNLLED